LTGRKSDQLILDASYVKGFFWEKEARRQPMQQKREVGGKGGLEGMPRGGQ